MIDPEPGGSEDERLVRSAAVLWRDLGDEVILTTAERAGFELLSPTASEVWRMLERPRTRAELATSLAEAYGEPADRVAEEIEGLLAELAGRGVVSVEPDAGR